MNAERLLAHYKKIADAPDAIPRMRRFILDLAVRGNLVEQDPNDEPAAELLKRIAKEKKRLLKASKDRQRKPFDHDRVLPPFGLPPTWEWSTIEAVAQIVMGQSPPSVHYNQVGNGLAFFQGKADFGTRHPTPRYWCTEPRKIAEYGDILMSIRAPVGPTNVADQQCCIGRGLAALRPFDGLDQEFLLVTLKAFESGLASQAFGTTFEAINKRQLTRYSFPLPPLAEQRRIVAKVDELMALCDRLEAARKEREETRDRLTAVSLARLSTPDPDLGVFHKHATFALDNFQPLTTRPDQIKALRQTILNLAVRGKLVEQDPNDEPAEELLKRIAADRLKLQKTGSIKKSNPLLKVDTSDAPFDPPTGWTWARFPEVGIFGRGKSKHRPRNDPILYAKGKYPFIQTGDVARSGGSIETYSNLYNDLGLAQSSMWPAGTLCITIAANIADSGILSFDACFPDSIVGLIAHDSFKTARFFDYFIRTAKANLQEFAPSTAQKNINLGILVELLIPLPPLAEQRRIVAKVDELITVCDRLEASLAKGDNTRVRLLNALLQETLH